MNIKGLLWFCFVLILVNLNIHCAQFHGIISLDGGKYYFEGKSSSLDLNGNVSLSPVITLDEEKTLYPVYIGYYRGIQDLQELAGGDILVRQRMGHNISIKYVRSKDFNHIKPRLSYSVNYIKETKDERWGDGLFDNRIFSAGIEFEQERPKYTLVESVDFFDVRYPNYASLISEFSTALDTTTYSELSKNAGKDVLNTRNLRLGLKYTVFPEDLNLTYSLALTYRNFYDQSIVNETGAFKSDKRKDLLNEFMISLNKADKKINTGVDLGIIYLLSNQNSYDASRTKYIDDYYGYISFSISPYFRLNFKNNGGFSYSFRYERLNYTGRLAQDINGNYLSSKIHQNFYINTVYFDYPVTDSVFAKLQFGYQIVDSNMNYEAGYKYNYTSSNLTAGIEWRF